MMFKTFVCAFLTVDLAAVAAGQKPDENWRRCRGNDPDLSIGACTGIIQSGREKGAKLAPAFTNRGAAYLQKDQNDLAIQDFDRAIQLSPDDATAFSDRGAAYLDKGEYDRTIQDCNQAIQLDPGVYQAFDNRGSAYLHKGQFDRAIQDFSQAIGLNPYYALPFYNRGLAYFHQDQYDLAIQDYDQAVRLSPNNADAFYNRGVAYSRKDQYDRAIQDYDQAIRLSPNDADAFYNRGVAYLDSEQNDRAIQDFETVIRLNTNYMLAFFNRGRANFFMARFASAVADFQHCLKALPSDPYAMLWLHLANKRLGQDDTQELMQQAMNTSPTQWPAPILKMYLGRMTASQLLAAAIDPDARKEALQSCEANFFSGEEALIQQHRESAAARFQIARNVCTRSNIHYLAAEAELKLLGNTSAPAK